MANSAESRMPSGLPLRALPLFFHLHVPKTAGSTINAVINAMLPGFVCWHGAMERALGGGPALEERLKTDVAFYDQYVAVVGHFGVAHPLVRFATRRSIIFSVFRDPIDRVVSHYDYIRAVAEHPLQDQLRERTLFQAFNEVPGFRNASVNSQIAQVLGATDPERAKSEAMQRNYCIGHFSRLPAFFRAMAAITGLPVSDVPRLNERPGRSGTLLARDQDDYRQAVAAIAAANDAEIRFVSDMPDVFLNLAITRST